MSKIIRLKKCEGWCKNRYVSSDHTQDTMTITNMRCLCSRLWLVNEGYMKSSFRYNCQYPRVKGKK